MCWFGELLTEKYNPGKDKAIDMELWKRVYSRALRVEWNNTVLNLMKKARSRYLEYVLDIFNHSEIEFSLDMDWCSYLYLNGIIDYDESVDEKGELIQVCRFSNPFIQLRLYNALTYDLVGDRIPIYALRIGDDLKDVFEGDELNLPSLIDRYRDYLKRLRQKNISPFKEQPKRSDLNIYESGGHFHLNHWLMNAVSDYCSISPELPTGNGRVDIHLRCKDKEGVIEVKSFVSLKKLEKAVIQASEYAKKLNLNFIVLVVFLTGVEEDEVMQLKAERVLDGVKVYVEPVLI